MTMLATFTPPACQTVIRAGLLASEGGATRLGDNYCLLALAESQPRTSPVDLGVTAAMVRVVQRSWPSGGGSRRARSSTSRA